MVTFICKTEEEIKNFVEGYFLTEDLKRVLNESGDPFWVESLLQSFREIFFKDKEKEYCQFSKIVDFRIGYKCYLREQAKRLEEAYKLRSLNLGRPLTLEEEVREIEENHISIDFRLYFLLEHPELCSIDKTKMKPYYKEALEWLLANAEIIDPQKRNYRDIIEKNNKIMS